MNSSKMRVTDSIFWYMDSSSSLVNQGPRRRKKAGLTPGGRIFRRISSSNTAPMPVHNRRPAVWCRAHTESGCPSVALLITIMAHIERYCCCFSSGFVFFNIGDFQYFRLCNSQTALSSPLPLPAAAGFVAFGAPLGPQEVLLIHDSRWALRIRSQLARSCSSNPRRWLLPPRIIKHGRGVRWENVRAPRHDFWAALRRDLAKGPF